MTPEKAAEKYAEEYGDICESIWDGERLAENAFLAGYAYTENRWVELSEDNLPIVTVEDVMLHGGIMKHVLCTDGQEIWGSIVGDHNAWYYDVKEHGCTHYMVIPAPPQPPEHG